MSAPNLNFNYQERLRRAKQYNKKTREKNQVIVNTNGDSNYEKYNITAKQVNSKSLKKSYQLSVTWRKTQNPVITLRWST